jgi:hypothetical protein
MGELIALLDRPSTHSMGAVPFVSKESERDLVVHGLSSVRARPIADDDLQELVQSRQAIRIAPIQSVTLSTSAANPVAMGFGTGRTPPSPVRAQRWGASARQAPERWARIGDRQQ